MLLYYITDRTQFPGNESQRRGQLLDRIAQAARCGVDFIQLREKDLGTGALEELAREAVAVVRAQGGRTRLLVNSRIDVALVASADGVHLRSSDVSPVEVRKIWRAAESQTEPVVAVSCHTEQEVAAARSAGADFVVFGPVFEKAASTETAVVGLEALRVTCRYRIPIVALGGVALSNAAQCVQAGARGVAGIRLFQQGNLDETVRQLRSSRSG